MTSPNQGDQPLILNQLKSRLHAAFDGLIDLSDVQLKTEAEREQYFCTRAYAALVLMDQVGISPSQAGEAITDGGEDDGIDAVYIDENYNKIYFIQSKWNRNLNKGISLPEITWFRDGINSIINCEWTDENRNLHKYKDKIQKQTDNIETEILMIFAHTSSQKIAKNITSKIDKFISDQNIYNPDFIRFKEFKIPQAVNAARSVTRPENIDVVVMLNHWSIINDPYKSAY